MFGSVNEELLALIFFSQCYFLIEGIFCPERSTKYKKNLAQQFTTLLFLQHGNEGICGVKHQLASDKVTNILFTVCQVCILVNQKENVVLAQVSLGATDSVQSKISLRKQLTFCDATPGFPVK